MAEKEYIEREAFVKIIKYKFRPDTQLPANYIIDLIRDQPAANVQEVRHGKNVTTEHPVDEFVCSECGIIFKDFSEYIPEEDIYREFIFKCCPNCGAKMDKE